MHPDYDMLFVKVPYPSTGRFGAFQQSRYAGLQTGIGSYVLMITETVFPLSNTKGYKKVTFPYSD